MPINKHKIKEKIYAKACPRVYSVASNLHKPRSCLFSVVGSDGFHSSTTVHAFVLFLRFMLKFCLSRFRYEQWWRFCCHDNPMEVCPGILPLGSSLLFYFILRRACCIVTLFAPFFFILIIVIIGYIGCCGLILKL
jgi:hypothetical protein